MTSNEILARDAMLAHLDTLNQPLSRDDEEIDDAAHTILHSGSFLAALHCGGMATHCPLRGRTR